MYARQRSYYKSPFMKRISFVGGLAVVLFQLFIISCNNIESKTSAQGFHIVKLDYHNSALSSIPEFSKIRFIPLETMDGAYIGAIDKIVVTENRFYVLDAFSAEGVFIYNWDGTLVNKIKSKGKGPREYGNISGLEFDPYNNELVLVDVRLKKVIRYDIDGNYLSENFFEFGPRSIGFIDKNTYVIETGDHGSPFVITCDHDGKNKIKVHDQIFGLIMSSFHCFPKYKNNQYYFDFLKDTIWKVEQDKLLPFLIVDFNERAIDKEGIEKLRVWANQNKRVPLLPKSKSGQIDLFLETDRYIQFFCKNLKDRAYVLIEKRNMEVKTIANGGEHIKNPMSQVIWSVQAVDEAGRFIGYITADRYQNLVETEVFQKLADSGVIEKET
jgi:hypothetical protein